MRDTLKGLKSHRSQRHLLIEYLRRFGRFQRNARLYVISAALSGISAGIVLILYNLYLLSLGYQPDFIGLVLFMGTIGAGLAIFPAGLCVDRFGSKVILIWSSLLIGAIAASQLFFRQPLSLLISGFLLGVAGAALLVVNAPFLTRNSSPEERPHLFSLYIVLGLVTSVLGEVLGGALPAWFRSISWLMGPLPSGITWLVASQSEVRSYQFALILAGLIAVPSFIPLFLLSNDRPASIPYPQQQEPLLQNTLLKMRQWRQDVRLAVVLRNPMSILIAVQVLIGLGAGLVVPYFNIYFVKSLGTSPFLFGLIDGGANTVNALFTLAAPGLAMRIGKIRTITVTRLISIPLLLTVGFSPFLALAAFCYLFRQGMMDMSLGIFQVFSMEAVPEGHRGLANSSYQASSQIAWAITTPLGGLIIVHFGFPPAFFLTALLYLLGIGVLWLAFGRKHERPKLGEEKSLSENNGTS